MSTTTTPPATVPHSNVVPFSMPWGGAPFPPGCCPPGGGLDALMKCYCDVQATLAFMSQIMQTLMTTDPNVQAAMVTGLEKTGSNLPLIGVTNGVAAQPGQVGEAILFSQTVTYTAAPQTQVLTMGVMQPGDWAIWCYAYCPQPIMAANLILSTPPTYAPIPGMSGQPQGFFITDVAGGVEQAVVVSPVCQLLIATPTLIPCSILTNQNTAGPAAGTLTVYTAARRMR